MELEQAVRVDPPPATGLVRMTTVPRLTRPVDVTSKMRPPPPRPQPRPAAPCIDAPNEDHKPLFDMSMQHALFKGMIGERKVGTPISALF